MKRIVVKGATTVRIVCPVHLKSAGVKDELNEAKQGKRLTALQKSLKRVDLLILDEMGYVTVDLPGAELLFQVLASRHETSSTIVTSNLMFSEWIKPNLLIH